MIFKLILKKNYPLVAELNILSKKVERENIIKRFDTNKLKTEVRERLTKEIGKKLDPIPEHIDVNKY